MAGGARKLNTRWLAAIGALSLLLVATAVWYFAQPPAIPSPAPVAAAQFIGTETCASCHQAEFKNWQGSHHDLAMQVATRQSVLAPFNGERFTAQGVTSSFSQRDGTFFVRTAGADGQLQDFEVSHTLGFTPLQQYLIPLPGGAIQALTIAWDSRPKAQGGQRWFDLQAGEKIRPGSELHWTGRQNNWNFMCAECHTTQFQKNYNATSKTYQSHWSAINVGCEACHGPGSTHVDWARGTRKPLAHYGLLLSLDERKGVHWPVSAATGNAQRSKPPGAQRKEVEMCARCHAHRSQISDDYRHGKPLLDTHVPTPVDTPLYWPDGQMRAEVYNDAPFRQSKMFHQGVTCSDCHEPHSQKLRLPGDATCLQCHAADKYQAATHHHHAPDSKGAQCAACHMPTSTYMTVDPRHDHFIRVPRPDLSVQNGTPNACTHCHTGRSTAWAAQAATQWYPQLAARTPSALPPPDALAQALARGAVRDAAQLKGPLNDADAQLRRIAAEALAGATPAQRTQWLLPRLRDPVRAVRIAAARALAGVSTVGWEASDIAALQAATAEYTAVQQFNADRPEALSNLGLLYADQGRAADAEAMLKQAMAMETDSPAAALNLADLYRALGREADALALLQQLARQFPDSAATRHALGLALVRAQRLPEALAALQRAAQLEPGNRRYAEVLALARKR